MAVNLWKEGRANNVIYMAVGQDDIVRLVCQPVYIFLQIAHPAPGVDQQAFLIPQ